MAWKLGQDSTYKLFAKFKDGNKVYRYSFDWKHKLSKIHDPALGLSKLRDLVRDYGANAEIAIIYENIHGTKKGKEIERYENGYKIS